MSVLHSPKSNEKNNSTPNNNMQGISNKTPTSGNQRQQRIDSEKQGDQNYFNFEQQKVLPSTSGFDEYEAGLRRNEEILNARDKLYTNLRWYENGKRGGLHKEQFGAWCSNNREAAEV